MNSSYIYNPIYEAACYLVPFVIAIYVLQSSWFAKFLGEKHIDSLSEIVLIVIDVMTYL